MRSKGSGHQNSTFQTPKNTRKRALYTTPNASRRIFGRSPKLFASRSPLSGPRYLPQRLAKGVPCALKSSQDPVHSRPQRLNAASQQNFPATQQTKRQSRPTWKARIGKPLNTSIKKQCCADSGKTTEKVSRGHPKAAPKTVSGALRSITLRPISLCEAQLQASEQKAPYRVIKRGLVPNRMQIEPRQREPYLRPNPTSEHCKNRQNAPYIY